MGFEVGQKVRCVDDTRTLQSNKIQKDEIYTISENKEGTVKLKETGELTWCESRFELIEDEPKEESEGFPAIENMVKDISEKPKEEKDLADRISDLEDYKRKTFEVLQGVIKGKEEDNIEFYDGEIKVDKEESKMENLSDSEISSLKEMIAEMKTTKFRGVPPITLETPLPYRIMNTKDFKQTHKTDAILKELPEAFGDDFKCQVCDEKIEKHAQLKKVKFRRKTTQVIYDLFCHTPKGQTEEIIFTKKKGTWTVEQKCLPRFELRKTTHKIKRFDRKTIQKQRFEDLKKFYGDDLVCPCCKKELQKETQWCTGENHISKFGRLKTWFRRRPILKFNLCCHDNGFMRDHFIRFEKLKDNTWRIHSSKY